MIKIKNSIKKVLGSPFDEDFPAFHFYHQFPDTVYISHIVQHVYKDIEIIIETQLTAQAKKG